MLQKPEDFIRSGSRVFRKAPVNTGAIQGWIRIAEGKAADAHRTANSATTRLGAAYDSVLNLGLAVLCKEGWRCTSAEGHHAQALEAACAYAGISVGLADEVDAMRDLRNGQYQGVEPTQPDVEYALKVMGRVVPEFLNFLKA
ncbi:hypothetical protein [Ramlibacter sp.]|uniref:hypothetical protein n=1 Tax=Ramlibacter sp. TaxID=1917967 RepID=UPI003D0B5267